MRFDTGSFEHPRNHHEGYFKVFRFEGAVEIWIGKKWYILSYKP